MAQPYQISQAGGIAVVRFAVPTLADPGLLRELSTSLATLVRMDDFRGLLFNMEGVKFVVSAFLNVLLTIDREMPAQRKPIRVCCAGSSVQETFELTRLHTKFPLFADQASALGAFQQ